MCTTPCSRRLSSSGVTTLRSRYEADRGASIVAWGAALLLIAALVTALIASSLPGDIAEGLRFGACRALQQDNCEYNAGNGGQGGGTAGPGNNGQQGNNGQPGNNGRPPPGLPEPAEPGKDDGICPGFTHPFCSAVDGLRLGVGDVLTDAWDGVTFLGCLAHICSHEGFKSNWSGIGSIFTTNPITTIKTILGGVFEKPAQDWKNGNKVRAVFRGIVGVGGAIFGGKGLTKLGKGKGAKGDAPKSATDLAKDADNAARRAENAARKGDESTAIKAFRDAEEAARKAEELAKKDPTPQNQQAARNAKAQLARARRAAADARVRNVLLKTSAGKQALDIIDRHNIQVVYTDKKRGAYYDPRTKTIVINPSGKTPAQQALSVAHEATHAEYDVTGRSVYGKPHQLSRQDYVNGMLREEAAGEVRKVEVARELAKSGQTAPPTWFDGTYSSGYAKAVADAEAARRRAGGPPLSDAEKQRIGRKGAYDAIYNDFKTGRVPTSTTGQGYPDFYGGIWDQANPNRP